MKHVSLLFGNLNHLSNICIAIGAPHSSQATVRGPHSLRPRVCIAPSYVWIIELLHVKYRQCRNGSVVFGRAVRPSERTSSAAHNVLIDDGKYLNNKISG